MARQTAEHWTEVDGRRVFYRTLAAGPAAEAPPLLLLHGISCCTETWQPLLGALGEREDAPAVIVPDLPAHGRSAKPDGVPGMADFAAWAERLLVALNLPAVDVLGHSMGCQVALALAQQCPGRVRRLVLLGPTTGARHVSALRNALGLMVDSAREPLAYNLLLTRVFLRMGPLRYLLTVREMQRDDAFCRAREVAAPTLVLQGARDAIVPGGVGRELSHALPCSEYAQIPRAAHAAQFSHPRPMAGVLLEFLGARRATAVAGRRCEGEKCL